MTATDVKVAIIRSGLTQRTVARQLGLSEVQMSNVVRGLRSLTADEQAGLVRVLGQHAGADVLSVDASPVLR